MVGSKKDYKQSISRQFTLTEEEIKEIIKEAIRDVLLEMPLPRKAYKSKVDSEIPQILENWCLVRYCSLTQASNTKNHWKGELCGHFLTASRLSVKGNNSQKARLKVLSEIWQENDYDKINVLNMTVINKFFIEEIDTSSQIYKQVLNDCLNAKQNIFSVILSKDINSIKSYIETI